MARRSKRQRGAKYCVLCGLRPEADDHFYKGRCRTCREKLAAKRRAVTGQRLLDRAKTSTVERDGQTFIVKTLPPKRKGH